MIPGIVSGSAIVVPPYVTTAKDYNGTTNWGLRGGDLTGIADGKKGTFSVWFRIDGSDGIATTLLSGTGNKLLFYKNVTTNQIVFLALDSGGGFVFQYITTTAFTAGATWRHVIASWDTNTLTMKVYVDDVSETLSVFAPGGTIDYTPGNIAIGASNPAAPGSPWDGCLTEFFLHTDYIELDTSSNRRKFRKANGKPENLGADGSTPFGVQPVLYFKGDPASNLGSGGNFTNNAALSACSSSPSD